ncbi:phosphatidylserine/phosphatidylglycerophosphate/cardiolipin synthase family protein [Sphingomonas sp.]|uniref:phospholipase D-like domain-containing protein n=1 Tax=Sphingomonas sp. TaxID=28214 RepID=UPI0025EFED00|nr:phosphatidylserine/phosphatidylglycerophosphate/cardiolipin synthase family protein [Sphingomonas sp.]
MAGPTASDRTVTIDGNQLTLLTEGPQRLAALLGLIDGAKKSLRLLYYIYTADRSGEQVRDALIRAVDRGVGVALLIDGFGSGKTPENYFQDLHAKGARFCRFNPAYGRRYLLRNHQKLALADCETDNCRVLIGGFNVEDSYFGTVEEGAWRDIGLIVEGPVARRLGPYYDALMGWAQHKGARLKALRGVVRHFSEGDGKLQWQFGGPMQRKSPWTLATVHDLAQAKNLDMIAAYFAPMASMLSRIARVASTGGRVRVVTASKSDNRATIDAARFTYSRLLRRRVEMFEYLPTKLHSKLLIMDNVVHIGSSNFDIRSLYLNMEMMLRVDDPDFAMMMRGYFEHEIGDSIAVTAKVHKDRGNWFERIRWWIGFFLVNSLDFTVTRRLVRRES